MFITGAEPTGAEPLLLLSRIIWQDKFTYHSTFLKDEQVTTVELLCCQLGMFSLLRCFCI